jgi:hypothetical protein
MLRRLVAGLAAAALGTTLVAAAVSPALADSSTEGHTQLSLDASPEPVRHGRLLTLAGKLSVQCDEDYISGFVSVHHADYCKSSESWHRLGFKRVAILFRADGSAKWEYVESVRTNGSGYFGTKVPAYASGTWRAVFDGAKWLDHAEATDWVKVVGHRH